MNKKPGHYRWIIIMLIFLICMINYIDRAAIAYAVPLLKQEFHLNADQLGWILGAFGVGYAVTTLIGGFLTDRFGTRAVLSVSIFLWSFALILTGLSQSALMLLGCRILLGFAEGPCFPAITKAIGYWLPRAEQARALSLALVSVPVAIAIGSPICSSLVLVTSWRTMFLILGASAMIWLPIWLFLFRDRPEQSRLISETEREWIKQNSQDEFMQTSTSSWRAVLLNKTFLVNCWAFFVFGCYLFFFMNWLPAFLKNKFQLDLKTIGLFDILPWTLAGLLMLLTGLFSDRIYLKTKNLFYSRTCPILFSQLFSMLSLLPLLFSPHLDTALICISLAVAISLSANAPFYAINIDLSREHVGKAMGIMDMTFALSGFFISWGTGWLMNLTGSFKDVFGLMAGLAGSSVLLLGLFHRPDKSS